MCIPHNGDDTRILYRAFVGGVAWTAGAKWLS
jgi:hypothetical protein